MKDILISIDIKRILIIFLILISSLLFLFIIDAIHINPSENLAGIKYQRSIFLYLGYFLIICGIFFFFINFQNNDKKKKTYNPIFVNENIIKLILFTIIVITFFLPSIEFSDMIIDWESIGTIHLIKAIGMLIGVIFLPGSNLYNIIFPENSLGKKFKLNSIVFKFSIYPLLSLSTLGLSVLIFDSLLLKKEIIRSLLFLEILIIFAIDLVNQLIRGNSINFRIQSYKIKLSKDLFTMIMIIIGIFFISFALFLKLKYLIPHDRWRGIAPAYLVGHSEVHLKNNFNGYARYWGCISFGLSALCGLPAINTNAILFPLLYLHITWIYLLMRAILIDMKKKYASLSTISFIITGYLYYYYNMGILNKGTRFAISGLFLFSFHTYSFITLYASIAFFIITLHQSQNQDPSFLKIKDIKFLFLSAFFFFQSYMTYFITFLPGFLLILIYSQASFDKGYKRFHCFWIFFVILFISVDILSNFFFSWYPAAKFYNFAFFFNERLINRNPSSFFEKRLINALIIYTLLCIPGLLLSIYNKIYRKILIKRNLGEKLKSLIKFKKFYNLFIIFFCLLAIIEIYYIFFTFIYPDLDFINIKIGYIELEKYYIFQFNHLIFTVLGLMGIIGIFSVKRAFNKIPRTCKILIIWNLLISFFACSLFIIYMILSQKPFVLADQLSDTTKGDILYIFGRLWHFNLISLSVFSSFGLSKLMINFNSTSYNFKIKGSKDKKFFHTFKIKNLLRRKFLNEINKTIKIFFISILLFFSFSNTIVNGFNLYNYNWRVQDDTANMMGWITENIPHNSKILIDNSAFNPELDDISYSTTSYFWEEKQKFDSTFSYNYNFSTYNSFSSDCDISLINRFENHNNILQFSDFDINGFAYFKMNFAKPQKSGTISYYIRTNDASKRFNMRFFSEPSGKAISSRINIHNNNIGFFSYNGSNLQKVLDIYNDKWYKVEIDFECTEGGYKNLDQYEFRIRINNEDKGIFNFHIVVDYILFLTFSTEKYYYNYITYIDQINTSWNPNLEIEKLFNYELFEFIDFLEADDFKYFIYSSTQRRELALKNNLLKYLFKKKLYESGDFILYCSK